MTGSDYGFVVDIVSNLGAVGFILWLVWRTTNHTIPRLAKNFEDNIKDARTDFRETLNQQRIDFRESLRDQRESHESRIDSIIELAKEK